MIKNLEEVFAAQEGFLNALVLKHDLPEIVNENGDKRTVKFSGSMNTWLKYLVWALKDEVEEFDKELLYKHWSNDKLDYHNLCVELVDMFCFIINIAIVLKLNAEELLDIWQQKMEINQQRQKNNYNKKNKTEADNKAIEIKGLTWEEWQTFIKGDL